MEPYTIDPAHQHPNSIRLLHQFNAFRVAYKLINHHPVHAFFLVPKQLPPGPRPLLVRFHGGGFVEGEAEASLRPFFLELALKHGAVILTPDYRLRPEHEMADGVADVKSFWQWVEDGSAQRALSSMLLDTIMDINNLLVGGESGGGYYTLQTALLGMTKLSIRVLFVQYPAVCLGKMFPSDVLSEEVKKTALWEEAVPYSVVEEAVASAGGKLCTRAPFASRMHLLRAMVQAGKFADMEKDGEWLDPIRALENAGKLPPVLLYHSKEDEAVPWQHTDEFAAKLRVLQPDVPLYLTYQKGEHVFDKDDTMATPWLKEPLEFVQSYWPA